ncbi:hypothetical protein DENSPDRAFT_931316 [Dentipellis sp. KUC8613]|nr:hypothetical protein DENSPDRAFT_931316 [Dentipellis sp. KUC8613]
MPNWETTVVGVPCPLPPAHPPDLNTASASSPVPPPHPPPPRTARPSATSPPSRSPSPIQGTSVPGTPRRRAPPMTPLWSFVAAPMISATPGIRPASPAPPCDTHDACSRAVPGRAQAQVTRLGTHREGEAQTADRVSQNTRGDGGR